MLSKLIHLQLAILVFVSSTGVVLRKHYCQDQLKNTTFFVQPESCHRSTAKSCPMHAAKPACPHHQSPQEDKKKCCDDHAEFLKVDHEQQFDFGASHLLDLKPVLASTFLLQNWKLPQADLQQVAYLHYRPPLLDEDLPVLLQTFRC